MKKILILGGTGMVGGLVLKEALNKANADASIGEIISIGRREVEDISKDESQKIKQIILKDFLNYPELKELKDISAVYFCLGTYTAKVSKKDLKIITYDYVVSLVKAIQKVGDLSKINFCFLSGAGADLSEKSKISFAKYKGMAENFLLSENFASLVIFRPGYIYPVRKRKESSLIYSLSRVIYQLFYPLVFLLNQVGNGVSITSTDLAKAMFIAGLKENQVGKPEQKILENNDITKAYLA